MYSEILLKEKIINQLPKTSVLLKYKIDTENKLVHILYEYQNKKFKASMKLFSALKYVQITQVTKEKDNYIGIDFNTD